MRRFLEAAAVSAAAATFITGCSAPDAPVQQPASIVGFAHGIDSELWSNAWVAHADEPYLPSNDVRNISVDPEGQLVDCVAVDDGYFSFDTDDDDCGGFWGDGSKCDADENEHCKAIYAPTYSFEQLTPQILRQCRAQLRKLEYKPITPTVNEDCKNARGDGQWVSDSPRFVIWLTTKNPDFDGENPDEADEFITASQEITEAEWQQAERGVKTTAVLRNGEIEDVILG